MIAVFLLGFVGLVIGIKTSFLLQLVFLIGFLAYMCSSYVRRKEIEGIIDLVAGIVFFMGMLIGDTYVLAVYGPTVNVMSGIQWLFKP